MKIQHRIDLLTELGHYILKKEAPLREAITRAGHENGWFIPAFVEHALDQIAGSFLQRNALEKWVAAYPDIAHQRDPKKLGIVMAGNIPLVGFHDWLSVFISGHQALVKLSSRDQVLLKHLVAFLESKDNSLAGQTVFADMLRGADAYIATGSNNSSRYFDYYFGKFPHIIRRNRTTVALLDGKETPEELSALSDDVSLYFGLGCRNVTKIYVPEGYDFVPLLEAFGRYDFLADHHKYKNNYDYNLALHLLNKKYYMTNGSLLLVEQEEIFSPISQLNYSYYQDRVSLESALRDREDLQGIVGRGHIPFGMGQTPALDQYADGVDTLAFLTSL